MKTTAYTYDDRIHCVACTLKRFGDASPIMRENLYNNGMADGNGLRNERVDSRGRPVVEAAVDRSDDVQCAACNCAI